MPVVGLVERALGDDVIERPGVSLRWSFDSCGKVDSVDDRSSGVASRSPMQPRFPGNYVSIWWVLILVRLAGGPVVAMFRIWGVFLLLGSAGLIRPSFSGSLPAALALVACVVSAGRLFVVSVEIDGQMVTARNLLSTRRFDLSEVEATVFYSSRIYAVCGISLGGGKRQQLWAISSWGTEFRKSAEEKKISSARAAFASVNVPFVHAEG